MTTTTNIPRTTLAVGSRTFGPHVPDAGETSLTLTIDRTVPGGLNSLTPSSLLTLEAQASTDGGSTWHAVDAIASGTVTRASTAGGLVSWNDRITGQPRTLDSFVTTWTLISGTGLRVQAISTVSGPSSIVVAGSIVTS